MIVQRRFTSCCSSVENIPLQAERHSARRQKLFAFPPESAFTFRPECCSESQRNRVRLQSGIAFTFDRIPHFEVELRHPGIKWQGFADLIELRDDLCTIEDFKSGEPSDDHVLQLQIYALLWCHDEELNPSKTAVDKLVICYPNGDRLVPYNKKDVGKLTQELQARTNAVRQAVSGPESQANLDAERCPKCDVRHLCSAYWTGNRPASVGGASADRVQLDDVQLSLRSRKGQNTWSAECQLSNHIPIGSTVLLRWTPNDCAVLDHLLPGSVVRLSGALISYSEDTRLQMVNCSTTTDLILPS